MKEYRENNGRMYTIQYDRIYPLKYLKDDMTERTGDRGSPVRAVVAAGIGSLGPEPLKPLSPS